MNWEKLKGQATGAFHSGLSKLKEAQETLSATTAENSEVAQRIKDGLQTVSDIAKGSFDYATSAMKGTYDSIAELTEKKLNELVESLDFDETIEKLQAYQEQSGKDLSQLIHFIQELQKIFSNGKE